MSYISDKHFVLAIELITLIRVVVELVNVLVK